MQDVGYLGIDVSKGYADFVLLDPRKAPLEEGFVLDDTPSGGRILTDLVETWFSQGLGTLYCGVESTGGYENNWFSLLCGLAARHAIKVARLNPKAVKACGEAALMRTQTDQVSAFTIASYLIGWPEKIRYSPRPDHPEDPLWGGTRQQVRFIGMLIKQKTQLSNQLEKLLYQHLSELLVYCRHGIPGWMLRGILAYPCREKLLRAGPEKLAAIKGLSLAKAQSLWGKLDGSKAASSPLSAHTIGATARQILHLQTQIGDEQAFLRSQFIHHPDVKLLTSIKGVAVDSAVRLVTEIEDITRFTNLKALCAYFGVHPSWKQSGDGTWNMGMSKKGRPAIRATLYMCSLSGIRCNSRLKKIYHNFRAKGMNHYQAMGVVMHKLLRIVYGILKSRTPYDPQIDQKNTARAEKKRKQLQAQMAETKQQQLQLTYKHRFNHSKDRQHPEEAPISRRAYQKRKQAASQSSTLEEHTGSPPAG